MAEKMKPTGRGQRMLFLRKRCKEMQSAIQDMDTTTEEGKAEFTRLRRERAEFRKEMHELSLDVERLRIRVDDMQQELQDLDTSTDEGRGLFPKLRKQRTALQKELMELEAAVKAGEQPESSAPPRETKRPSKRKGKGGLMKSETRRGSVALWESQDGLNAMLHQMEKKEEYNRRKQDAIARYDGLDRDAQLKEMVEVMMEVESKVKEKEAISSMLKLYFPGSDAYNHALAERNDIEDEEKFLDWSWEYLQGLLCVESSWGHVCKEVAAVRKKLKENKADEVEADRLSRGRALPSVVDSAVLQMPETNRLSRRGTAARMSMFSKPATMMDFTTPVTAKDWWERPAMKDWLADPPDGAEAYEDVFLPSVGPNFAPAPKVCGFCEEDAAEVDCQECRKAFCGECSKARHKKSKEAHTLTPIVVTSVVPGAQVCEFCEEGEARVACPPCEVAYCNDCFAARHKKGARKDHQPKAIERPDSLICRAPVAILMESVPAKSQTLAVAVLAAFGDDDVTSVLKDLIELEIQRTVVPSTLLRSDSPATKLFGLMATSRGIEFIRECVGPTVQECIAQGAANEGFTSRVEDLKTRVEALLSRTFAAAATTPEWIRNILRFVWRTTEASFPGCGDQTVGALFFLRMLAPALATPESFFLTVGSPNHAQRASLVDISKVVVALANGVQFKKGRPLAGLNSVLEAQHGALNAFYSKLLSLKGANKKAEDGGMVPPRSAQLNAYGVIHLALISDWEPVGDSIGDTLAERLVEAIDSVNHLLA